jgi:probable rRNA maturation factor
MSDTMRYQINLKIDPRYAQAADRAGLRAAARAALEQQQAPAPAALTLLVSDDATLHRLNREFLDEDHPTDVLSFPDGELDADTGRRYFGDIAVSLPTARRQAQAAHHPLIAELQLLVVHGVLHLLGHDHAKVRDKTRMWQAQDEILAELQSRPAPKRR